MFPAWPPSSMVGLIGIVTKGYRTPMSVPLCPRLAMVALLPLLVAACSDDAAPTRGRSPATRTVSRSAESALRRSMFPSTCSRVRPDRTRTSCVCSSVRPRRCPSAPYGALSDRAAYQQTYAAATDETIQAGYVLEPYPALSAAIRA
jgi:hypothetical protein